MSLSTGPGEKINVGDDGSGGGSNHNGNQFPTPNKGNPTKDRNNSRDRNSNNIPAKDRSVCSKGWVNGNPFHREA